MVIEFDGQKKGNESLVSSARLLLYAKRWKKMKLLTSYYGKAQKLRKENVLVVNIATKKPNWFFGISYEKLFPERGMLRLDEVEYTKRYEAILSRLPPMQVYRDLDMMMRNYGASAVALVCWEKPEKFRHRHLVAKWFKEKLGMDVKEYDYNPRMERYITQLDLF